MTSIEDKLYQRFKDQFAPISHFSPEKRVLLRQSIHTFVEACFQGLDTKVEAKILKKAYLGAFDGVISEKRQP